MPASNSSNLKLAATIIKPSLYALTILFISFIISINWYHNHLIKKDVAEAPEIFNKTLQAELSSKVNQMRIALDFLSNNKRLIQSLKNKNRQSLWELSEPVFLYLRKKHNISHFYFTGKSRKNIHR